MKLTVLDGYALNPGDLSWESFEKFGDFTVYERTAPCDVISRIGDSDMVFTNKTVITREIMESCPSMKYIGVLATGFNVVDIKAARELGVAVTNIPAYSTDSVAQHVFALLLEICSRVGYHSSWVREGNWVGYKDFCYYGSTLMELHGKTMGIIGMGRIGYAVSKIAQAFGMKVLAFNRGKVKPELEKEGIRYVSFDELLSKSDVISLHCPLNDESMGLMGRENIAKMKDGAILINTARGPMVDETALYDALKSGKLAGAAMDVLSVEPMPERSPLLDIDNCIITPHIAWAPLEARKRLMVIAHDNVKAYAEGRILNRVEL